MIRALLDEILAGRRMTEAEALTLFSARGREVWAIAAAADEVREQKAGDAVTYVRNQNLNLTNICINSCGFCGFCRKIGDPDAYFHGPDEVLSRLFFFIDREQ
jgi:FO synthase subunit 2